MISNASKESETQRDSPEHQQLARQHLLVSVQLLSGVQTNQGAHAKTGLLRDDLETDQHYCPWSTFQCQRLPIQSAIIRKALAVPLAARIQAPLDVTEALVLERLNQLEKIHQQVLKKEKIFFLFLLLLVMYETDFSTDIQYPHIVQLLLSHTDINRY